MKKYLSILAVSVLVAPSVALASWWNPFTWSIFRRVPAAVQTQKVETATTTKKDEAISKFGNVATSTARLIKKDILPLKKNGATTTVSPKTDVEKLITISLEKKQSTTSDQSALLQQQIDLLTRQIDEQKQQSAQTQQSLSQIIQNTTPVPPPAPKPKPDLSALTFRRMYTPHTTTSFPGQTIDSNDSSVWVQVKDVDGKWIPRPVVKVTVTKDGQLFDTMTTTDPNYFSFYKLGEHQDLDAEQGMQYNHPVDGNGDYVFTFEAYGKTATETLIVR